MDRLTVQELAAAAREQGWTQAHGSLGSLRLAALRCGWIEVPARRGDSTIGTLRPTTADEASPRSLSAVFGLGAQPLHTDGAHLPDPPDIVVLYSDEANQTPTQLWHSAGLINSKLCDDVAHGVFRVRSGTTTFLTTVGQTWGVRYDPGCMIPQDQRARRVAGALGAAFAHSTSHFWAEETILVIDNLRTLHARGSVPATDTARKLQRLAYITGTTP